MLSDDVREQVRASADIVEVIGEHVALKKAGKQYRGLCPFHQEKTPSFHVSPERGFYKCFGCEESGDVFSFLMKTQGLGFGEVLRQLAARYGVVIPERQGRQEEDPHRALYEALAFAADYFRRQLTESEEGGRARAYLRQRGVEDEAAERFMLGCAPAERRALRAAALRQGIDDEVLLSAGLSRESDRGEEPYDRFRGRLIFPICDVGGRVVGFGGRLLEEGPTGAPKYLNSPETPVYRKSRMLYGLNWSRSAIRRAGEALLVEGYMDYLALAARGVEHVVAGLGTALAEEQAELLSRYARKALLLYDSDAAGLRASFRAGDVLLRTRVHPLIVSLPAGEDPDSLVRQSGVAALQPLLDGATDILELKLRILEERGYLKESQGMRKALDAVLPTLRAADEPALRDIYIGRVASSTGMRRETLESELRSPRQAWTGPAKVAGQRWAGWGSAAQRKLLLLLVRDAGRISEAAEKVQPEDFSEPVLREVYEAIITAAGASGAGGVDEAELSGVARERLAQLRLDREDLSDGDRIFKDTVNRLVAERLHRRLDELQTRLSEAQRSGDETALEALTREKMRLMREMRELNHPLERLLRRGAVPVAPFIGNEPEPLK